LIYYLTERRQNKRRWERTLEAPPVPLRFIWGLADPVSGKQISDHIRARVAGANLLELPEVGHYPQLEAPDTVAREIGAFFSSLLRS
jgi:pimeloyl-ACP methyl ester carboxylesterase